MLEAPPAPPPERLIDRLRLAIPGLEAETRIEKDKARELQAKVNDLF